MPFNPEAFLLVHNSAMNEHLCRFTDLFDSYIEHPEGMVEHLKTLSTRQDIAKLSSKMDAMAQSFQEGVDKDNHASGYFAKARRICREMHAGLLQVANGQLPEAEHFSLEGFTEEERDPRAYYQRVARGDHDR